MRRASRSQPGLGARSELSTPARIRRAAETCRAAAARSWIRTRAPSVPHDCRPNAAVLRLTRRGGTAARRAGSCARRRRRGCGARVRPWRLGVRGCAENLGTPVFLRGQCVFLRGQCFVLSPPFVASVEISNCFRNGPPPPLSSRQMTPQTVSTRSIDSHTAASAVYSTRCAPPSAGLRAKHIRARE